MADICVIGLGYVGLPTAALLAVNGHNVWGVDIDHDKVNSVNVGKPLTDEPSLPALVCAAHRAGALAAGTSPRISDVFIIAVPTPLGDDGADMSYVQKAVESILPLLRPGDLVILESTSPPGATDEIIEMVEGYGLKGAVGVAYCPERVLPGRAMFELVNNSRVIGVDKEWAKKAEAVYKSFVQGEIIMTDPKTAEIVKLSENAFRDVNIAYANELRSICERNDVDVRDVVRIANKHPRVNILNPGVGVGGHCISIDPYFLKPDNYGLIATARRINNNVPIRLGYKILELVEKESKVALFGMAYKPDIGDIRESPAITVYETIEGRCKPVFYDPYVEGSKYRQAENYQQACDGAELIVVLTPHSLFRGIDPKMVSSVVGRKCVVDPHDFLDRKAWRGFKFL